MDIRSSIDQFNHKNNIFSPLILTYQRGHTLSGLRVKTHKAKAGTMRAIPSEEKIPARSTTALNGLIVLRMSTILKKDDAHGLL